MKRLTLCLCVTCVLLVASIVPTFAGNGSCARRASAPAAAEAVTDLTIRVAPSTIVLESDGDWITVHTDIALSAVNTSTITLNGVAVAWTKADAKGNLVAKFAQADIKAIIAPPEASFELLGTTNAGEEFSGYDTVPVR